MHRSVFLLLVGALLSGCGGASDYPPISGDVAKDVKSGTPLAEIVALLGEAHPPTSYQASCLAETVARMPERIRANAEEDKSLAWGNDSAFLAVKVNQQDVAWVTAWRSGARR